MKTAYLSLGSNIGDREARLREAIEQLEAEEIQVVRRSATYETEPRDRPGQPWFLNMAVEVKTALFPRQLLARIQAIEASMGRRRDVPKGPRVIDIDILFFGNAVIDTDDLQIPHPRLAERRFVLEPMAEIAPDLRHPVTGKTVREMLRSTAAQNVRLIDGS